MKRMLVLLLGLVLVLAGACGGGGNATTSTSTPAGLPGTEVPVNGGSYRVITPAQLYAMMPADDFLLVNIDVVPSNIIQGTDLYVKPAEIQQNLEMFPSDKAYKIVLYCMAGGSFPPVASALVAAGYTRVMALEGGIIRWTQQGYPVTAYTAP